MATNEPKDDGTRKPPNTVSSSSFLSSSLFDMGEGGAGSTNMPQSALFPDLPFDQPLLGLPASDWTGDAAGTTTVSNESLAYLAASADPSFAATDADADTATRDALAVAAPFSQPSHRASETDAPTTTTSLILGGNTLQLATPSSSSAGPTTNTVPEFLYQLTKMLTDNNREIIEWSNGKIEVHSPHKLESHVLNNYFRHSKFASFQRQLNYFGFRKLAGKGKMAPCSYVNDDTTDELASLLHIKRKPGGEGNQKRGGKKRDRDDRPSKSENGAQSTARQQSDATDTATAVNPVLAGILHRSSSDGLTSAVATSTGTRPTDGSKLAQRASQKAIARVAVGKGIRHGLRHGQMKQADTVTSSSSISTHPSAPPQGGAPPKIVVPSPVQASLNALTNNFKSSLQDLQAAGSLGENSVFNTQSTGKGAPSSSVPLPPASNQSFGTANAPTDRAAYVPGSMRRDDSLVDLAMIPLLEDGNGGAPNGMMDFVDFPFDPNFLGENSS